MSARTRIEKHRGMTLTVQDGELTIIKDGTGMTVSGPVDSDVEVKWLASRALPFLMALTETFEEWKKTQTSGKTEAQHIIEDKQTGG